MSSNNIQIAIKVRPLIEREKREKLESLWMVKENSIVQIDGVQNFIGDPYSFDHIFDDTTSNKEVYDGVVKPLVMSFLEGINATIFAYGQTSSGKTHTMLGNKNIPGIIDFTVEDIFAYIEKNTAKHFLIRCSYLEIYNEKINDLFDTNAKDIKIREDYNQGVYVTVKEEVIREPGELFNLMKKGMKTRKIGCTDMNERSSRSHTIFRLVIQSQNKDSEGSYTESTLSLVDLAGSERVGQMNMGRERQVEGVSINKSLTTLGLVIRKLSENETYINYRDSKLTRLLQYSLGGNSKTLIIATITVAAAEETKSTLEFAQRAKYVKNRPIVNERVTDKDQLKQYENLCEDYKEQIEKLRLEKIERDRTINALEDKISNIKLFTAGNCGKLGKSSRMPQRRHTLGHYKPHKKQLLLMDSGVLEENSDSEDRVKIISPVKSEICLRVTNADDQENSLFDDSMVSASPSKCFAFRNPNTPKTPFSKLRFKKELLEESHFELRCFTDFEKQFQGEHDTIKELRDFNERLRQKNVQLKEENLRLIDIFTKANSDNKDVYDGLIILRTILGGKPFEEIRRLQPIAEEDIDLISDNLDSSECSAEFPHCQKEENTLTNRTNENYAEIIEENQTLKRQINDNEHIINDLKNDINTEKLNTELVLTQLNEENRHLKSQIDIKDATIWKLKNNIIQDKEIKEAELEFLNNKIKKFNDYKEDMHRQLSELRKAQETLSCAEDIPTLKLQNAALKEDLKHIKQEYTRLQQSAGSDRCLIEQLKEENEALTKTESEKEKFNLQKQLEIDTLKKDNELLHDQLNDQLNILDNYGILKEQNDQLKAEIDDLKVLLNDQEKKLAQLNEELEKRNKDIEDMEKTIGNLQKCQKDEVKNLTEINVRLGLETVAMKEQIDLMQEENIKLKGEVESNFNIKQQFDENVAQMELWRMKMNDFVSLEKLINDQKAEIDDLKNKLHSKVTELDEKSSCYFEVLSKYNLKMSEFEHLTKENSELMEKLGTLSAMQQNILDNKCLNEENRTLKIELQDAIFQLAGEQKELENLCLQLDEKTQKIDALEKIISDLKYNHENQLRDIQQLREINSTLRHDLLQKEDYINMFQKMVAEDCSREKCQSSRLELDQIKEQFTCISKKLEEITEHYNSVIVRDSENNNLIKTLKDQIKELEKEKGQFSSVSKIDNLRQLVEERTGEVNCLKEERIVLMQRIDNLIPLEQTVGTLKRDLEILKFESEKQKYTTDDLTSQLVLEKVELEKQTQMYNELLLSFSTKDDENQQYVKQIATLEEERTHLMKQLASLEETVNRYVDDIHKLETICEVKTNDISELESQLHSKIIELREKTDAHNDVLYNYKQLMEKVEHLENEKEHLTTCINSHVSLEGKIDTYIKDIQDLQDICEDQKTKIDKFENQLDMMAKELEERTKSYNKLFSDYTIKEDEYRQVKTEIENMKIQLVQALANNAALEETVSNYLNDLQTLQKTSESQIIEINELKDQLHSKNAEFNDKIESYEHVLANSNAEIVNLKKKKDELMQRLNNYSKMEQTKPNYLNDLKLLQATSTAQKSEIKELKDKLLQLQETDERSELDGGIVKNYRLKMENCRCPADENTLKKQSNNVSQLHHYNDNREGIELLTHSSFTDEMKTEIKEVDKLQEDIRSKSEEIERVCDDRRKLKVLVQELGTSLSDTKRQLKERCEDYFHLKNKNNAIEIELFNYKKNLAIKDQELQNEKMRLVNITAILQNNTKPEWKHLSPEEQIANHKRELENTKQELRCQTLQSKTLQEELEKSKELILDAGKVGFRYEKCIQIFKRLENVLNEAESKHLLERYVIQEKSCKAENEITVLGEQLVDRLKNFERCYAALKSQYNDEKSKSEYLNRKLLDTENQVITLQAKVYESVTSHKRIQESQSNKNPVSRISDENRPMSPNDLRKIKRRSIHDQRRGLAPDSGGFFEDDDLEIHQEAQKKLEIALAKNHQLEKDIRNIKGKNELLASENKVLKHRENIGKDLGDCKRCIELRSTLCKYQEGNKALVEEIDNLKKENTFLDKENEDMLQVIKELEKRELDVYEELEKYKNSSSHTDMDKIQIKLNDLITKNTELHDELSRSHKVIARYKDKISKLELKQSLEDHRTRTDSQRVCSKEDKETQATCDLHQANINLRKLAQSRRKEANYLRGKLNLPLDCPVLPEDLQQQSKSKALKDCAPE